MPTPQVISSGSIGGARRARLLSRGHIPIAHGYLAPPCPLEDPKPWEHDGHIFGAALAAASARFGSGIVLTGPAAAFAYGAHMLRTPAALTPTLTPAHTHAADSARTGASPCAATGFQPR